MDIKRICAMRETAEKLHGAGALGFVKYADGSVLVWRDSVAVVSDADLGEMLSALDDRFDVAVRSNRQRLTVSTAGADLGGLEARL